MNTWNLIAFLLVQMGFSEPDYRSFPHNDFSEKVRTVEWMMAYDSAAWRMSEFVTHADSDELARMGRDWFCYKDADSLWNGVYGKFKDGKYDLVLHYRIDPSDSVVQVKDSLPLFAGFPDSVFIHPLCKATKTAYYEAGQRLGKSYVRFNKFVRLNSDRTITIWLLPALQPNEIALYGGEFYYHFDVGGDKILDRWEYYQGSFKGFRFGKTREVTLQYDGEKAPTLGAVFFALQYREQFKGVQIETMENSSMLLFNPGRGYYWEHKEKDMRKVVN